MDYGGKFYPVAVYLGGFSRTIVRVIDSAVVDLINRAEVSGNGGGNNTGGGIIPITPGGGTGGFCAGHVEVQLGPPSALAAGGAWRVTERNIAYTTNSAQYIPLQGGAFTIEFREVPDYIAPSNRPIPVVCGQDSILSVNYRVMPPHLSLSWGSDLTIVGASGAKFRIEQTSNLGSNWTTAGTVTLTNRTGILPVTWPPTNNSRFYRAVWLP